MNLAVDTSGVAHLLCGRFGRLLPRLLHDASGPFIVWCQLGRQDRKPNASYFGYDVLLFKHKAGHDWALAAFLGCRWEPICAPDFFAALPQNGLSMLKIKRGYLEGRSDGCFGSSGDRLWQRWRSLHHIRLVRSWYLQRGSQFWRSLTAPHGGNGHLFNAMESL